ncbi:MAG TPA: hypothetical protein VD862_04460 [Candidatus Paceibacterota bacterium]|nr:hypothetical protein [Candidatus Paceibacterota bacterium]
MNVRLAFPVTMFVLAGVSFGYGAWQHLAARSARAADASRLAYILQTIEHSDLSRAGKQDLYVSIASGLPSAPPVLGIDFSGSFAALPGGDSCVSDGQRALCRALITTGADDATRGAVCGGCSPE